MKLIIQIPCFNEEATLPQTVDPGQIRQELVRIEHRDRRAK